LGLVEGHVDHSLLVQVNFKDLSSKSNTGTT